MALRRYSPEEKKAICRAYLLGDKTQAELGAELGIPRDTISRITNDFKHQQRRLGRDPKEALENAIAFLKVAPGVWHPLYRESSPFTPPRS